MEWSQNLRRLFSNSRRRLRVLTKPVGASDRHTQLLLVPLTIKIRQKVTGKVKHDNDNNKNILNNELVTSPVACEEVEAQAVLAIIYDESID